MNTNMPNITLNNGVVMPHLGLGVYDMHREEAEQAVATALRLGYRLIDTATMYGNEKEVGQAVRQSGIPREEVFVTTKLANPDQGYDNTLRAFEKSERTLDIGRIDLYLVHWPIRGKRKDSWKALERLVSEKRVRAIGVANYLEPFLDELSTYAHTPPAVNQVEFSPYLFREGLLQRCRKDGVVLQAYTPLTRGQRLRDPRLVAIASRYGRSTAQVILRWLVEMGICPIPKSVNPARLAENLDVFNFELKAEDRSALCQFDEGLAICGDPLEYL
jgi:diketogulonate reductase-like aldo/keto reductase